MRRILKFSAVVFLLLAPAVRAQETSAQAPLFTHSQVNEPIHFDVSPPVSQLAHSVPPAQGQNVIHAVRIPKSQKLTSTAAVNSPMDAALQTSPGALVSAFIGLNLLGVG